MCVFVFSHKFSLVSNCTEYQRCRDRKPRLLFYSSLPKYLIIPLRQFHDDHSLASYLFRIHRYEIIQLPESLLISTLALSKNQSTTPPRLSVIWLYYRKFNSAQIMSTVGSLNKSILEKQAAKYDYDLEKRVRAWMASSLPERASAINDLSILFQTLLKDGQILCEYVVVVFSGIIFWILWTFVGRYVRFYSTRTS